MSFLRSPGSEGSGEAPPTLCTWPSNRLGAGRLGAGRLCLGVWIQPLRGQLSQDMGPDGLFFHLLLLRASPRRIPNMCPCWDCHPPAEYPSQLCCTGWGVMSPCPREAGVPNELISVGKALGDLGLKGVQYTRIRVIVITHNYGVSAGEIIPKRTVAGPAQSPAKICSSTAVESIFLPCLPPFLPPSLLACSPPAPGLLPALPQQMPSLSHPSRREAPGTVGGGGDPGVASHSLEVRRIQEPSLTCLFL